MNDMPSVGNPDMSNARKILLPPPKTLGRVSVEEVLQERRSVRDFSSPDLTLEEVGQLLWAAQGVTHPDGRRTAPSAGPLYPLELVLVAGEVEGLEPGAFRYASRDHTLGMLQPGDLRPALVRASLGQEWMRGSGAIFVFAGVYRRTAKRYGERAFRYVVMEVGHAVENLHLQAVALGLGATVVGAFQDEVVRALLGLESDEDPLAVVPVGRR
jgi:SagB-type dehydrogenase family enzyme